MKRSFNRACALVLTVTASPAMAAAGLDGLASKIDQFNGALITIGGAVAVTGFIWACLAMAGKVGGAAGAVTALVAGLCISNAKTIVGFFTGI